MLISVKMFTKYVMIIYAFKIWYMKSLASKSNQSRSKFAPKAKFPAGLDKKNG